MADEIKVEVDLKDLARLIAAFEKYEVDLDYGVAVTLLGVAQRVAADARDRFTAVDSHVAHGYTVQPYSAGKVFVKQRQRRTTGLRPDFGTLQMRRALLPARSEHKKDLIRVTELMLDEIAVANGF